VSFRLWALNAEIGEARACKVEGFIIAADGGQACESSAQLE
jgi:hypothetical protein